MSKHGDTAKGAKLPIIRCNIDDLNEFEPGHIFKLDDGKLSLEVVKPMEDNVLLMKAKNHYNLQHSKRILPGNPIKTDSFLQPQDIEDIQFGLKHGVGAIIISFVELPENVLAVRKMLGGSNVQLIAKIETERGVENAREIMEAADGIMIARVIWETT